VNAGGCPRIDDRHVGIATRTKHELVLSFPGFVTISQRDEKLPEGVERVEGAQAMADARRRERSARVGDVCEALDGMAPPALAAEWDNVGLLIGDRGRTVRRVILTIDLTEAVLAEARRLKAEMAVAYHPPIFHPIKRLTAQGSPVAYAAARSALAVYSPHTALDAAVGGTNDVLAEATGIGDAAPLEAADSGDRCKIVSFMPACDLERVSSAAFAAGAGRIGNYTECSFRSAGVGTFRGGAGSAPAVGRAGRREQVEEVRMEVISDASSVAAVVEAIRAAHSYETPAIDVYPLAAVAEGTGTGRVGPLARPVKVAGLIGRLKRALGVRRVQVAGPTQRRVTSAACCAGSAGGVFRQAVAAGADAYVTGEMRHHHALEAAGAGMTVICVGHWHSERLALGCLADRLTAALPSLKASVAKADRDPFEIV